MKGKNMKLIGGLAVLLASVWIFAAAGWTDQFEAVYKLIFTDAPDNLGANRPTVTYDPTNGLKAYATGGLIFDGDGVMIFDDVPTDATPDTTRIAMFDANGLLSKGDLSGSLSGEPDNTITVGASGADYTTLQGAIDSITDSASTNTYLINVAAGYYDDGQSVIDESYVTVSGSWGAHFYRANATNSPVGATIRISASNVTIQGIAIENPGVAAVGGVAVGMSNSGYSNVYVVGCHLIGYQDTVWSGGGMHVLNNYIEGGTDTITVAAGDSWIWGNRITASTTNAAFFIGGTGSHYIHGNEINTTQRAITFGDTSSATVYWSNNKVSGGAESHASFFDLEGTFTGAVYVDNSNGTKWNETYTTFNSVQDWNVADDLTVVDELQVTGQTTLTNGSGTALNTTGDVIFTDTAGPTNRIIFERTLGGLQFWDGVDYTSVQLYADAADQLETNGNFSAGSYQVAGSEIVDSSRNADFNALDIGSTLVITAARVLQNVTANTSILTAGELADARVSDTITVGASGSVNDSALSSNVPLKNAANTFTEGLTVDEGALASQITADQSTANTVQAQAVTQNSDNDTGQIITFGRAQTGTTLGENRAGLVAVAMAPNVKSVVGNSTNTPLEFATNNVVRNTVTSDGGFKFVPISASPAASEGVAYYDSDVSLLYVYTGAAYIQCNNTSVHVFRVETQDVSTTDTRQILLDEGELWAQPSQTSTQAIQRIRIKPGVLNRFIIAAAEVGEVAVVESVAFAGENNGQEIKWKPTRSNVSLWGNGGRFENGKAILPWGSGLLIQFNAPAGASERAEIFVDGRMARKYSIQIGADDKLTF